jgi:chromosome segregation ATPase
MSDYNDRQELEKEVTDRARNIEALGEEQQEHQEDLEELRASLKFLKSKSGIFGESGRSLQNSLEMAVQARESSVEVCKEKINVVKVETESKLENLNRKIAKEKERTIKMEQASETLNRRNDGVVANIEIRIQQSKDDIEDATDKGNDFMKIINVATQIATAASVSATAIGQIISSLQSIGLFR